MSGVGSASQSSRLRDFLIKNFRPLEMKGKATPGGMGDVDNFMRSLKQAVHGFAALYRNMSSPHVPFVCPFLKAY